MSGIIYIVGMFASIAAIMWCMYHIGWGNGNESGWWDGHKQGWTEATDFYGEVIDEIRRKAEDE